MTKDVSQHYALPHLRVCVCPSAKWHFIWSTGTVLGSYHPTDFTNKSYGWQQELNPLACARHFNHWAMCYLFSKSHSFLSSTHWCPNCSRRWSTL